MHLPFAFGRPLMALIRARHTVAVIASSVWLTMTWLTAAAAQSSSFQSLEGAEWPTPDSTRRASGAPSADYWQQQVDYRIEAQLDEGSRKIGGVADVVYHNNSPDELSSLWLLLDQNIHRADSVAELSRAYAPGEPIGVYDLRRLHRLLDWKGGYDSVTAEDTHGRPLRTHVNGTLMRLDLPRAVAAGAQTRFRLRWTVNLPSDAALGGRSGYECFASDGNCIFAAGYWFPRLTAYSAPSGWQYKQFLGGGEYSLEFGNYDVSLTVPADHIVAATGELANPEQVLSPSQRERLRKAAGASAPVMIVTPQEASSAASGRAEGHKTWRFKAKQVRDFAFASSRRFIWDAMGVRQNDSARPLVMAMSFYPEEARPLWDAYSTRAMAHTLEVFGELTFAYPYPVVQSVNGPAFGIEHPMLSFTSARPARTPQSGAITYPELTRMTLISTIIHETGHNWFPMVVNSDEREWSWLDEGLVSHLQAQAMKRWSRDFRLLSLDPRTIPPAMRKGSEHTPIMAATDELRDIKHSAYAKPAAALAFLRETVLGPAAFDEALKAYANRWRFRRATPFDFFRTMQDVSGVDLAWFWRGWFYSTDYVDIALEKVEKARLTLQSADPLTLTTPAGSVPSSGATYIERHTELRDFYDERQPLPDVAAGTRAALAASRASDQRDIDRMPNLYLLTFANRGGLVSPIPLRMSFADGSSTILRVPAEVWRKSSQRVVWRYVTDKALTRVEVDPFAETFDADSSNNAFAAAIPEVELPVKPLTVPQDAMRDARMRVLPDSLIPVPED